MDQVKYLSNQTTAQNGQYPLTIQGLEFIQQQILCLHNIVALGGDYYIIREPSPTASGVVVFNGEIMPLTGTPDPVAFITVETIKETIHTSSGNYTDVREVRVAKYSLNKGIEFRLRNLFKEWKTNAVIWDKLHELIRTGTGIPVVSGIFSRAALDAQHTTARLVCLDGSARINDYATYGVDIYVLSGGAAYQELRGPDFRKWGRYYRPATQRWDEFQPITDQLTIEAKVTSSGVFFRHGFLPPYANLVALRKKTRSRKTGKDRPNRPLKNAWYNAWKMTFTKGEPNTWYAPKCLSADTKFTQFAGHEFASVVRSLLFISSSEGWRIAGVHRNWSKRPYGYAKIGLGIVVSKTHDVPAVAMTQLKFRIVRSAQSAAPIVRFTTD